MAEKFDPRFNPAFQPGFEPSKDATPPRLRAERPAGSEPVAEPSAPTQAEPENPSEDVEGPAVERNPFERTLWIVAAVLVIGGIAITFWSNSTNYYTSGSEFTWQQVLQQVPLVVVPMVEMEVLLMKVEEVVEEHMELQIYLKFSLVLEEVAEIEA